MDKYYAFPSHFWLNTCSARDNYAHARTVDTRLFFSPPTKSLGTRLSSSVLCFIFGSVLFGFSHYLMAGNFRRRKLSQNSQFCGYLESFLHEIWGRSFGSTSEQSVNVFSAKKNFSPVRESFLPRKFPAIYSI